MVGREPGCPTREAAAQVRRVRRAERHGRAHAALADFTQELNSLMGGDRDALDRFMQQFGDPDGPGIDP